MMDEAELLDRYATKGDEEAFTELVRRSLPLVYSAALRQVRRPELAEEVTQVVFIILARKAKRLDRGVVLSGWLYQTTRYACRKAIRTEVRRIKRERDAAQQGAQMELSETHWKSVEPMLDDLMARMREQDRLVLVLRFFEGLSLAQIGDRLGTTEDAAQKRVARALDRLRALFARRSVRTSSTLLASLLASHSVVGVPTGLAAGVAVAATSSTAAMTPLTATLLKSTLNMMTWIKIKAVAPVGAAVAVAASVPIVGLHQQKVALQEENAALEAAAAVGYTQQDEELGLLREKVDDLESLREQAKEVHRLRARVSQLTQERAAMQREMEAMKNAKQAFVHSDQARLAQAAEVVDTAAEHRMVWMNSLKQLALGLHMYAGSHEGQFPEGIGDMDPNIVAKALDGIEMDDLVMIDYGTLDAIEEPQISVVFASKETIGTDQNGTPVWAYAFGDGHSEISPFEVGDDGRLIRE